MDKQENLERTKQALQEKSEARKEEHATELDGLRKQLKKARFKYKALKMLQGILVGALFILLVLDWPDYGLASLVSAAIIALFVYNHLAAN